MQLKSIVSNVGHFLHRNSPYILTGLGCAGVVSTAIMTGQASVKANEKVREEHINRMSNNEELDTPFTMKEKVMLTWKYFLPPALMGAASVACIIGAQTVNTRRHAALASLYTLTESTLKDYRENVVEALGKNKEEKAYNKVAQDRVLADPPKDGQIVMTEKGNTLFKDSFSGRYFKSDIEVLRRVENDLNHMINNQMWVPINDFYTIVGLETIKLGEDIGWDPDELIEFKFIPTIVNDEEVCIVLDYNIRDLR